MTSPAVDNALNPSTVAPAVAGHSEASRVVAILSRWSREMHISHSMLVLTERNDVVGYEILQHECRSRRRVILEEVSVRRKAPGMEI